MSGRALTWAWEQVTRSSGERLVLVALADRADEDGHCWPSAAWLGRKTGLNERTVRRHLDTLDERGLLRRERRHRANGELSVYDYYLDVQVAVRSSGHPRPVVQRAPVPGSPAGTHARADTTITEPTKETTDVVSAGCFPKATFEDWYERYPRKMKPQEARKAWAKLKPDEQTAAMAAVTFLRDVYDAARANAEPAEVLELEKYTPYPATWLNGGSWDDDPDAVMGKYARYTRQGQQTDMDRRIDAVLDHYFPEEER